MAEATADDGASSSSPHRYFCHQCNAEVQILMPEYTCANCQSGFIEELEREEDAQQQRQQQNIGTSLFGQFLRQTMGMQENPRGSETSESTGDEWDGPHSGGPSRRRPHRRSYHTRSRSNGPSLLFSFGGGQAAGMQPGGSLADTSAPVASGGQQVEGMMMGGPAGMDMFVQQLFNNLGITVVRGSTNGQFGINGVLGDYAIGANGLDNIITQLLNQLDNTGPPPADKTSISSLPISKITQKQVDDSCECSICRDEYKLDESVKELPCKHLFHPDCVDPWLDLHDSCPICRCNLNGERPKSDT